MDPIIIITTTEVADLAVQLVDARGKRQCLLRNEFRLVVP